jgi:hypothetical protein
VTRSKLFVRERFGKIALTHVYTMEVEANIERTRFLFPEDEQHSSTGDYLGLVRAADLIGQVADVNYLRKIPALFAEFRETGVNEKLGFRNPEDLRTGRGLRPSPADRIVAHDENDGGRCRPCAKSATL